MTEPIVTKDEIRPFNHRLNPRLCVRFTSSRTEGKLEVRRSSSLLPLSNCRLSRNGRANTFRVWAAFLTSGLSARYSTIVSLCRMLNSLNTVLENSINALTASLSCRGALSHFADFESNMNSSPVICHRGLFNRFSIFILRNNF